jgi:hypothetical protein
MKLETEIFSLSVLIFLVANIWSPPTKYPYFGIVVGLVWLYDPESCVGVSICYR